MLARYNQTDFCRAEVLAAKPGTVTVCIPARNSGELAGHTVRELADLVDCGLIDQILVVDGSSDEVTSATAHAAGAEVRDEADLLPEFGPVLGKGDAMWRALSVCRGDFVCFVDSDLFDFRSSHVVGLLGALFLAEECSFAKATYRRPLLVAGHELPDQGGRVTELTARPLLEILEPRAAEFRQPLAGECAGARELFESLSFTTGYGVEIAMLVDLVRDLGLERLAEVDLGTRRNPNQGLEELGHMAREVVRALMTRVDLGRLPGQGTSRVLDRPPMISVRASEPLRS